MIGCMAGGGRGFVRGWKRGGVELSGGELFTNLTLDDVLILDTYKAKTTAATRTRISLGTLALDRVRARTGRRNRIRSMKVPSA